MAGHSIGGIVEKNSSMHTTKNIQAQTKNKLISNASEHGIAAG